MLGLQAFPPHLSTGLECGGGDQDLVHGIGAARCDRRDIGNVADGVIGSTRAFERLGNDVAVFVAKVVRRIVPTRGRAKSKGSVRALTGISAQGTAAAAQTRTWSGRRAGVSDKINAKLLSTRII